jgi:RimJ/RimL family protein N-acetyltransferase
VILVIKVGDSFLLRKPEPEDLDSLYEQKNSEQNMNLLGGFHTGFSKNNLLNWINKNQNHETDCVWIIQDISSGKCIGHIGFYRIEKRIQSAEFAILIGDHAFRGKGFGRLITKCAINFGFNNLNLFRISLEVLSYNMAAIDLYSKLGFVQEGVLRSAQYKNGKREDVIVMSILKSEWGF